MIRHSCTLHRWLPTIICALMLSVATVVTVSATEQAAPAPRPSTALAHPAPQPKSPPPTAADLFKVLLHHKPDRRLTTRERLVKALLSDDFHYDPKDLTDPFVPFIVKEEAPEPEFALPKEEDREPPKPQLPLTPLQKMSLGEVESGLRAILLGPGERKALIEDNAGRGYIVAVGTPVTDNDGVITDIFQDGLIIRQQIWDRKAKRYLPKDIIVKLKKEEERK